MQLILGASKFSKLSQIISSYLLKLLRAEREPGLMHFIALNVMTRVVTSVGPTKLCCGRGQPRSNPGAARSDNPCNLSPRVGEGAERGVEENYQLLVISYQLLNRIESRNPAKIGEIFWERGSNPLLFLLGGVRGGLTSDCLECVLHSVGVALEQETETSELHTRF